MRMKMSRRECLAGGSAALLGLPWLNGCGGASGAAVGLPTRSAVAQWNGTMLQAITNTKPGPPIVARMLSIVHCCIFDAWAAYHPTAMGVQSGSSLRRPLQEHTFANKQQAISYAAYHALTGLFPTQTALFDAQMVALGYDPKSVFSGTLTPGGIGQTCAAAIVAFRNTDGANQQGNLHAGAYSDYTGYVPVNTPDLVTDPSKWQQLRYSNGASPSFLGAQWELVKPFALTTGSQLRPGPPPAYGSPAYRAEVQEIVDLTANLNDTQKVIAEYWADGPNTVLPPGHWCLFAQFVSQRDHNNLDRDVKMFFLVANAVFDAGIAAWDAKRAYNTSRPITAIRTLYAGQQIPGYAGPGVGIQVMDGKAWAPYQPSTFITPPFPEYVSGHSTFSAAAAEVLQRFTGSDAFANSVTVPIGWSKLNPNVPAQPVTLVWPTFSDAVDQAGMSRRYGGIHFQTGDLTGRALGRQVGALVYQKALGYFNETSSKY